MGPAQPAQCGPTHTQPVFHQVSAGSSSVIPQTMEVLPPTFAGPTAEDLQSQERLADSTQAAEPQNLSSAETLQWGHNEGEDTDRVIETQEADSQTEHSDSHDRSSQTPVRGRREQSQGSASSKHKPKPPSCSRERKRSGSRGHSAPPASPKRTNTDSASRQQCSPGGESTSVLAVACDRPEAWDAQFHASSFSANVLPQAVKYERLDKNTPYILWDIGSLDNLGGDQTVRNTAAIGIKYGKKPAESRRATPLTVSGVGKGSQKCSFNVKLPITMDFDGVTKDCTIEAPVIPDSQVPMLYGLNSMERNRTVLDLTNGIAYMCGPGTVNLASALPPGTQSVKLWKNQAGHIVTPCAKFGEVSQQPGLKEPQLALPTKTSNDK